MAKKKIHIGSWLARCQSRNFSAVSASTSACMNLFTNASIDLVDCSIFCLHFRALACAKFNMIYAATESQKRTLDNCRSGLPAHAKARATRTIFFLCTFHIHIYRQSSMNNITYRQIYIEWRERASVYRRRMRVMQTANHRDRDFIFNTEHSFLFRFRVSWNGIFRRTRHTQIEEGKSLRIENEQQQSVVVVVVVVVTSASLANENIFFTHFYFVRWNEMCKCVSLHTDANWGQWKKEELRHFAHSNKSKSILFGLSFEITVQFEMNVWRRKEKKNQFCACNSIFTL